MAQMNNNRATLSLARLIEGQAPPEEVRYLATKEMILYRCVSGNHLSAVQQLVAAGADTTALDHDAIKVAVLCGHFHIARILASVATATTERFCDQIPLPACLQLVTSENPDWRAWYALHQHGLPAVIPYVANALWVKVALRVFDITPMELLGKVETPEAKAACLEAL